MFLFKIALYHWRPLTRLTQLLYPLFPNSPPGYGNEAWERSDTVSWINVELKSHVGVPWRLTPSFPTHSAENMPDVMRTVADLRRTTAKKAAFGEFQTFHNARLRDGAVISGVSGGNCPKVMQKKIQVQTHFLPQSMPNWRICKLTISSDGNDRSERIAICLRHYHQFFGGMP